MIKATTNFIDLLRQVRTVAGNSLEQQQRLDDLVDLIAEGLGGDVASLYFRRAGDILELYATHGLRHEAVHQTKLRIGEGVVGSIAASAQSIMLEDAVTHPNFAHRPETGEDEFRAMMGVPLLHGGRVIGVLVVQDRQIRQFSEQEAEALAIVGMVIAEMAIGQKLINLADAMPVDGIALRPLRLDGQKLSEGMGMGRVVLHRQEVTISDNLVADDPEAEALRLQAALESMHKQLDAMLEHDAVRNEVEDILRTYRILAADHGWIGRIEADIKAGLSAEAAVVRSRNETTSRIEKVTSPELKERLEDLIDLDNRLLRHLMESGQTDQLLTLDLPEFAVLVARNISPAELLEYNLSKLQGVVLMEGSASSHVSIVARAMNLPMIGRVKDILTKVEKRDRIIVDGDRGVCFVRPDEHVRRSALQYITMQQQQQKLWQDERGLAAITQDGEMIDLQINAAMVMDMQHLSDTGASGVGLFRTELSLMLRQEMPSVEQLTAAYRTIIEQAEGKPITFRVFDIGSDKKIAFLPQELEENPAMGWRSVRLLLDRPNLFRDQVRALLAASTGAKLRIMVPMITTLDEMRASRKIILSEVNRLESQNKTIAPQTLEVGAMFEVPSLFWQIPELAKEADFISVGSNDLAQFFFAADRVNPQLDNRYDTLHTSFLRQIDSLVKQCRLYHLPLSICGEMAGRPLEVLALIGLGVRNFSMNPTQIGPIRRMVRQIDSRLLSDLIPQALASSITSLRPLLQAFAKDHQIPYEIKPMTNEQIQAMDDLFSLS